MQTGYFHAFQFPDGRSFHLYKGSLADVRADALVSSDDNYLSAGGGVSAALARVAGPMVALERIRIAQGVRPVLGDVVRTSAGGLPCRHLYHAITIDFDQSSFQSRDSLRRLVGNLLDRATEDGAESLGIPALGTGAAAFNLGQASEIIIDELMEGIGNSSVQRVVLALLGDEAERQFYEDLVRAVGKRMAVGELRDRDRDTGGVERRDEGSQQRKETGDSDVTLMLRSDRLVLGSLLSLVREDSDVTRILRAKSQDSASTGAAPIAFEGETIEQFASLVDERRLIRADPERPRLVSGLTDLILRHVTHEEIETELLSLPECHGFRGTVAQRLMEFLYLSEEKLRLALGPALFRTRDLRRFGADLELHEVSHLGHDELVAAILRELGFNILSPPEGSNEAIRRVESLLAEIRGSSPDTKTLRSTVQEAGRILERFLRDLLRVYAGLFWGERAEAELVEHQLIPKRREGSPLLSLTIGQTREALQRLSKLICRDDSMKQRWTAAGRSGFDIFTKGSEEAGDVRAVDLDSLQSLIAARNDSSHDRPVERGMKRQEVVDLLEGLLGFMATCRRQGVYPEVLRYEGTFENRHGERFVHFLDESGQQRMVRSDETIDPRRHYLCFATNNPVHLFPVLVPKD